MGHKGHYGNYSGNHPRFSKRQDEAYDAKMAYNKDLTGKARLHYLENDIADKKSPANSHCSPMGMHTDAHIKRQQEKFKKELEAKAKKIARRTGGDFQDEYYKLMSKKMDERSGKKRSNDERSGEERRKDIDEMIYERPDSPMNQTDYKDRPYARAEDAIRAHETAASLAGTMVRRGEDLEQRSKTQFGLGGIVDKIKDLQRIEDAKRDLEYNIEGHMLEDIQRFPQGKATYFDTRSGGIRQSIIDDPRSILEAEKKDIGRIERFRGTPLNRKFK